MLPITDEAVSAVFAAYAPAARKRLLSIRELIFATAAKTEGVGEIEETLKWGEPAYLTNQSKSGSTIRLGWKAGSPDQVAIYFNCNTTLVDTFRTLYPELTYQGNRAISLDLEAEMPEQALTHCIQMALTYHRAKRKGGAVAITCARQPTHLKH